MLCISIRYRMQHIMKLLENNQDDQVGILLKNKKYLKAFKVLEAGEYVVAQYAWGPDIPVSFCISKQGPLYLLQRSEVWRNRIAGFFVGIISTIASAFIVQLLLG